MPTKKKPAKKKPAKKKATAKRSGLTTFRNFVKKAPGVSSAAKRIKKLEMDLKAVKRKKAAAVKVATKKYKAKKK